MVTLSVMVTLAIPAHTLKEKRAVVQSLLARLRARHHLSAAEVGLLDRADRAAIGFAVVSGDGVHARTMRDEAMRFIETELTGRAEILDVAADESRID